MYNKSYADYLGKQYGDEVKQRYICITEGLLLPENITKRTCTYTGRLNCAGKLSYPAEVRHNEILGLLKNESMSASEISVVLDISVQSIYRLLKAMVKQGKIKQVSTIPRRYKLA